MSFSQIINSSTTEHEALRRALKPVAFALVLVTAGLTVWSAHDVREVVIVMAIVVATVIGVFGFLMPRRLDRDSAGATALCMSVIALLLLLPAFWSGLPLVLGAAGAMLGYAGRNATTGAGKSIAAFGLGVLASVGYFAIYVLEALSI